MAKELQVKVKCDRCGASIGFDVTDRTFPAFNSIGRPRTIDLCDTCEKEIYAPLVELVDQEGADPQTAEKKAEARKKDMTAVCLWCPATFKSDNGLMGHVRDQHGLPVGNAAVYGTVCPLDGEEWDRLAQHISQGHRGEGFTHISQAFAHARDNGDPHKVVKKVLARGT